MRESGNRSMSFAGTRVFIAQLREGAPLEPNLKPASR